MFVIIIIIILILGLIAKKTYTWSDGTVQVPERLIIVGSIGECVQMRHSSNVLLFFTSRCLLLRNFVCETDTTPTGMCMRTTNYDLAELKSRTQNLYQIELKMDQNDTEYELKSQTYGK